MKTKIYIVTLTNEDNWVSIVGIYKSMKIAQISMKADWDYNIQSLDAEGYIPVMKRDEFSATIAYGHEHFYRYQIHEGEV